MAQFSFCSLRPPKLTSLETVSLGPQLGVVRPDVTHHLLRARHRGKREKNGKMWLEVQWQFNPRVTITNFGSNS